MLMKKEDIEQWGKWFIALGLEVAQCNTDEELSGKMKIIKIGIESVLKELK
jgi:hypothetical protein